MPFQLDTSFTQQDLSRFLASGSNVVVAKPEGGGRPNVAWIVYRPLLVNSITWEEEYGMYASNAEIVNGARLDQLSRTDYPAAKGTRYPFGPEGFFGPPTSGGAPGSYTATNEFDNQPKRYLTMGLYQDAVVNGSAAKGNAVSAAPVIYQSTAQMTPFTTVYLWIQSSVVSNTVVTTVTSPMTKVLFGGPVERAALRYDSDTGLFLAAELDAEEQGIEVEELEPALA